MAQTPPELNQPPAAAPQRDSCGNSTTRGTGANANNAPCISQHSLLGSAASDERLLFTKSLPGLLARPGLLLGAGLATGGFVAADTAIMRRLPSSASFLDNSRRLSDAGAFAAVGAAGGFWLWGTFRDNARARETGQLAGEAIANGLAFNTLLQSAISRTRPLDGNPRADFFGSGRSFPSDHAVVAWSAASVIAHEYSGWATQALAYAMASGVSAARVAGREHFPSDVVAGSLIGWWVGRELYKNRRQADESLYGTFEATRNETVLRPSRMASPYVPLENWAYGAVDHLVALGLVRADFLGLRPWTRLEFARFAEEASERTLLDGRTYETSLITALRTEFAPELARLNARLSSASPFTLESVYTRVTGISGPSISDSYHFGQTLVNDYGRPYGEGMNAVAGASAWWASGSIAIYVRGEFQHGAAPDVPGAAVQQLLSHIDLVPALPFPQGDVNRFRVLDAYLAWSIAGLQFSAGPQTLWWGPGRGQSMMLSNNAQPMTMVRLTRTTALKLPSIFGWLGPIRFDAFLAHMDGHHFPADPWLQGQKISFKPTPNLELGFSRTILFAGSGRPLNFRSFWRGFSSVGDKPTAGPAEDVGDRRGGFDFAYRFPGLRNYLLLYAEGLSDDDPSPLAAPRRAAINSGIYVARFPKLPRLDFRAEGVYTSAPGTVARNGRFFYFNGNYRDAYTNDGTLLGSWVGRQGRGIQAWSRYAVAPHKTVEFSVRRFDVDPEFIPSGGHISDIGVKVDWSVHPQWQASTRVQYERWNFPLLSTERHSNVTTSLELVYRPHWPGSNSSQP